ncbi:DUF350 domain-containing protein [Cellulosilyticum sp. ST5]|uniref:DUF350 domain-containing protein n=1 Tax=Cellulosilyticum sp. ST5 TaxID=3055805 RepID=UPI003977A3DC
MLVDLLNVVIYSVIGVILMMIGCFLVDLAIPCDFPEEIKKGNQAVGFIMAGASIAIGIIVKSAVMSPAVATVVEQTLLEGITGTLLYSAAGIILCILGYLIMLLFNRKYNLNDEIGKGNTAAGIMIMGMFIGLGIVISGVIY